MLCENGAQAGVPGSAGLPDGKPESVRWGLLSFLWFRSAGGLRLTGILDDFFESLDAGALSLDFGLEAADFCSKLLECVPGPVITGAAEDDDDEGYQNESATTEVCFLAGFHSYSTFHSELILDEPPVCCLRCNASG